ncbi:hypothetical protein L873DRAFT_1665391 [Choiromyces venosus 120613-1]|uniref:DUF7729 domain-containing protein n=1 Tax=Choiromyces venosus 120613-1 TaxID=1336337 RepID=A0A3N4K682_9PEZI|nr:hypothetical protein L873DRAFT_1665391 [Choiromyces venosus 120613-1]
MTLLLPPPQVLARNSPTPTSISPSSASGTGTAGVDGITVQPSDDSNEAWPKLFDSTSISANSSSESCPVFFNKFLADKGFLDCLPLSGLLLNSLSYFDITKKGTFATTKVIDKTCNVSLATCTAVMEKLGWQIRLDENCGQDFRNQNPIVIQAYTGFISYRAVYSAGCLKSASGSYCYVDAITNVSSPSDSYVYYLPLGIKFPGGSRPTCSSCLSQTMAIFASAAGNSSQPLSGTYVPAAEQINLGCGPNFVNTTVEQSDASASSPRFTIVAATTVLSILFALM